MRPIRSSAAPLVAALVLGLALTGCTAGGASSDSSARDSGAITQQDAGGEESSAVDSSADSAAGGVLAPGAASPLAISANGETTGRQVVTTGSATITAKDPVTAGADAARIVEIAGGRVDGRTEQAPANGNPGRASLTLRIPSAALTATLDELKKLGTVVSVDLSTQDVTTVSEDLDARIAALSASVDRLTALLATANDTKVLIDLETAISGRQGDLESLQSQRRQLSDQVTMSSVTLDLVSPAEVPAATPGSFADALFAGLAGFAAFFTGAFFVLGYLLPWLLLAGVVALVVAFVLRRRRHTAAGVQSP
jgi:uncharacterized small protein (DUF1192 family)